MSKMRGKPDISPSVSTIPKDPTGFLEGGASDAAGLLANRAGNGPYETEKKPPVATVQKLFRMRWDIAQALKDKAYSESSPGHRVTETEIVENLLKRYFDIG